MSLEHEHINCPDCGTEIDVEAIMSSKLEQQFKQAYLKEKSALEKKLDKEQRELAKQIDAFQKKKENENSIFLKKLEKEKENLKIVLEQEVQLKFEQKLEALDKDLRAKQAQILAFNDQEIEFEKAKNSLLEKEKAMELAIERKKMQWMEEMEQKIAKQLDERYELKLQEKEKQLKDQRKLVEEMKRKADQGFIQRQGEVQEIAIENWLKTNFPFDEIEEIKKGVRGGDCIQHIHTRSNANCGTIYYESKRTKDFQKGWIQKFKDDIQAKGADIGVLVTQTMPKDMERMGERNGIWICTFEEFKGLSFVLRDTVIKIKDASVRDEQRGEKMHMLYDYLTSNEFKMQIEAVMDGFLQMENDLIKEKRAMASLWKQREKQIQKVIINTNNFYSSIKGIAGSAIPTLDVFELGEADLPPDRVLPKKANEFNF